MYMSCPTEGNTTTQLACSMLTGLADWPTMVHCAVLESVASVMPILTLEHCSCTSSLLPDHCMQATLPDSSLICTPNFLQYTAVPGSAL